MAFSRPPPAKRLRAARSFFSASVRFGGTMSIKRTWMPALARWAAMPLPMTPAPMTAARRIGLRMRRGLLDGQMPLPRPRGRERFAAARRIARKAPPTQAVRDAVSQLSCPAFFAVEPNVQGLSAASAACTDGRCCTRAENACSDGHFARSMPVYWVHVSMLKRYPSATEKVSPTRWGCSSRRFATKSKRLAIFVRASSLASSEPPKEGREGLVDLGRDEVQPLLHVVPLERARRGDDVRLGPLVGDVLGDDRPLGE